MLAVLLFCFLSTEMTAGFPLLTSVPSQTVVVTTSLGYHASYESENQTASYDDFAGIFASGSFSTTETTMATITGTVDPSSGDSGNLKQQAAITSFENYANSTGGFDYDNQMDLEIQDKLFGLNFGRDRTDKKSGSHNISEVFGTTIDIDEIMEYENYQEILPKLKQVLVSESL